VEADKIRIYQVISNLLINAIKFTQKNIASGSRDNNNSSDKNDNNTTITVFAGIEQSELDNKNRSSSNGSSKKSPSCH